MKFHHKGSLLVAPLNFYGSEETGVERLLTEYLSICFLTENLPPLDALDQARETLRRIEEWLVQQDKALVGFATPYGPHLHHSMPRLTELYVMATCCPWGYQTKPLEGKNCNSKRIKIINNNGLESAPQPLEWVDHLSDWRWLSQANKLYGPNPNWYGNEENSKLPKKFQDIITKYDGDRADDDEEEEEDNDCDKAGYDDEEEVDNDE